MAFETLMAEGDEACLAWLRARGSGAVPVELVEGALAADEAVALAHGLGELGRTEEALEVMGAVCATAVRQQGDQRARGWAQGVQVAIG
jgi:hypothetical protein